MTTPLGGPSQLLVKCRNNQGSNGNDIRKGDAVFLNGHVYDTNTGEPILLVSPVKGDADNAKFLGIAMSAAPKGAGGSGTGSYCHVCVFGLVEARVSKVGSAAVAAGEAVYVGGTEGVFEDGGSGIGVLGDNLGASAGSGVPVGLGVQAGLWGSSGGSRELSLILLNGIGRHAFGGT